MVWPCREQLEYRLDSRPLLANNQQKAVPYTGMGLRSGSPTCKQDVHKQRVASLPAFFFPLNFGEDRALRAASHSLLIPSLTRWCSKWMRSPLSTILSSIKVPALHEAFLAPSIFCSSTENTFIFLEARCAIDLHSQRLQPPRIHPVVQLFVQFQDAMWRSFKAVMSHVVSYCSTSEPASLLHSPTIPDIQCRTNNDDVLHSDHLSLSMRKRKRRLKLEGDRERLSARYGRVITKSDVGTHCTILSHKNRMSQMSRQENMWANSFPRCTALLLRTHFIANSTISPAYQERETASAVSLIPGAFMHHA